MSNSTNRRAFLKNSAVAAAALGFPMVASSRVLGANDRIHVGVAGIHGRGTWHIGEYLKIKGGRGQPPHRPRLPPVRESHQASQGQGRQHAQVLPGHPRRAGRQGPGCGFHCLVQSLAFVVDDLGVPSRQGRLRRKALQPQCVRRTPVRRGRAQVQPHRLPRHPVPRREELGHDCPTHQEWEIRQAAGIQGLCEQGPLEHRFQRAQATAQGIRFQPLAWPRARAALPREHRALQLALVLGFRQWRDRQPGRASDGPRALGHPPPVRCPRA